MTRIARLLPLLLAAVCARAERIPIAVSSSAAPAEHTAAIELAAHLAKLYPRDRFDIVAEAPKSGKVILLGTAATSHEIASLIRHDKLTRPESFVVTSVTRNGAPAGIIAGSDARGALFGSFALLEKLGCRFYLSYETAPEPSRKPFNFSDWSLADAPVFGDRVIFNWHNFLSSASTWELEDWQRWIRGAARMRFNTVMVHAYGNNPMFTFTHNGQEKPVGYLATTRNGRDWGTEHVNDVRRMWGGEVFPGPEFGSSAAIVPEQRRTDAARTLMRQAFNYARDYGMHVTFALDVDTESANPQNVILTLPESARFRSGAYQLPNPDTPEGYEYWKAQTAQLLAAYPQIDRLVVWFRHDRTPWRNVKVDEFPAPWQKQFQATLVQHPELRQDPNAPAMFALARVTAAFDRALGELKRRDIELGCGTWNFTHLPAAHVFFAPGVKLYWLDQATVFDKPETQAAIRRIPTTRPTLPIVWAHHDDRTFTGRPYTPFSKFTKLVEGAGTGFGIIHWTTRPLDLYFRSLAEQVWNETRDRPLAATTRDMAAHSFGASAAEAGGDYLYQWVTGGRMFGRDTGDRFIDVPLTDAADVITKCRARLALLDKVDQKALTPEGRERLMFYRDYDQFTADFFTVHAAFEQAQAALKRGDVATGRAALAGAEPAAVIAQYLKAARRVSITRGEQALVTVLNLKWLPYILSVRQALRMEPARFSFQATHHEPLAQGAGRLTFWLDQQHTLWKVMGEKETGAPAGEAIDAADSPCRQGIRITQPLSLRLGGIMGDRLAAGPYRVILTLKHGGEAATVSMRGGAATAPVVGTDRVVDVAGGQVEITIRPAIEPVVACSVTITAEPR